MKTVFLNTELVVEGQVDAHSEESKDIINTNRKT